MTILLVDCDPQRLVQTEELLRAFFPEDVVRADQDPLMAGKYVFDNPVDVVFAAWSMKRMDGPLMAEFVHRKHPPARVFLTNCPVEGACEAPQSSEAELLLTGNLTEAVLQTIFPQQSDKGKN